MANSVDPDQTAPIEAVCSRSTLFDSILNSSVMLGNNFQQTTSADDIFRCIFFLVALRAKYTEQKKLRKSQKTMQYKNTKANNYSIFIYVFRYMSSVEKHVYFKLLAPMPLL